MPGNPVIIGAIAGAAADVVIEAGKEVFHNAIISSSTDGGAVPMSSKKRKLRQYAFGTPVPRQLSPHEMARAAWTMIKDFMPRTKVVTAMMFNNFQTKSGRQDALFSGNDNLNTATTLHDRSGIAAAESKYTVATDVIVSGHSALVKNAIANSRLVETMIFPISHPGLIVKGDDPDQRLGDFINLSGIHMYGRIEVITHAPMYDAAAPHTPYPASGDQAVLDSAPRSQILDHKRRVRMMIIEVLDSPPNPAPSASTYDDQTYYGASIWQENLAYDASPTARMMVVAAPRLENILHIPPQVLIETGFEDGFNMQHGRWQKIDRKYRSSGKGQNLWIDPNDGRRVNFRVTTDISFNLKPNNISKRAGSALGIGTAGVTHSSYVDIDMFIKLNVDLSYPVFDAGADLKSVLFNADRAFFVYLFDDHMDVLHVAGVSNPTATLDADYLLDETANTGYSMCKARLRGDFFFTDDL